MFNIDEFVKKYITKREKSLVLEDMMNHIKDLEKGIDGKSVLVIGGAGSIGASFIKSLLHFKPQRLTVIDTNENGLAELTRDLRNSEGLNIPKDYITYPLDYSSAIFKKIFFKNGGFQIVVNFSAHKHVRSEKDIYSIEALLRNNVLNEKKLLDLLVKIPPEIYFCVSTDKAANPVNIMGASKRIMEDVIFSYSSYFAVKTARFANVAFSNGSLLDGFLRRMEKQQPISAPNDIRRYFVSLEESGQICLMACILGRNKEIFYPKLQCTQMLSFDKIAEQLLKERGYEVLYCNSEKEAMQNIQLINTFKQYPVYFSNSDTSGEKMYEEFYTENEEICEDEYNALGVIKKKKVPDIAAIDQLCVHLEEIFMNPDIKKEEIILTLRDYLPFFEHIETGKSLEEKM